MRAGWHRMVTSAVVLMTLALLLAGSALALSITSFTPINGEANVPNACPGGIVTITGSGFASEGVTGVAFNGSKAAWFQIGSDITIFAQVPGGATTGPITVTTATGTATSSATYTVVPCQNSGGGIIPPTPAASAAKASISSFTPTKAKAGATVTVTGSGFTGVRAVKIGGVTATFKVVSGTRITATVPAKAKSGKISVTTPAGTSTSAKSFAKA